MKTNTQPNTTAPNTSSEETCDETGKKKERRLSVEELLSIVGGSVVGIHRS